MLCLVSFFSIDAILNVLIQIILSLGLIIYLIVLRPFSQPRDNWIEIMNEGTILVMLYLCLGTVTGDAYLDGNDKNSIGYAMIAIVLLNIVLNFAIFIAFMLRELCSKLRAW